MNDQNDACPAWTAAVEDMAGRGFVFIHINKTGGSSVRAALGISRYEHVRASDVRSVLGRQRWSGLVTFSTIRNPWDRLVSMYYWRIKTNQTGLAASGMAFDCWLDRCLRKRDSFYIKNPLMLAPQTYWLSDRSGGLLVDKLLRFERLASDFSSICKAIGVEGVRLAHLKSTERKHYSMYFSDRDAELVGEIYADDIEAFGYRFEKAPA